MTAVKVNQRRGFRVRLPSSMFLAPDKTRSQQNFRSVGKKTHSI